MPVFTDQEIHLRDYLYILRKRRSAILFTFILVMAAMVILTSVEKILYRATATILIEKENPNVVDFKEVMAFDASTTDYYQTQYQMLKSRTLVETLIKMENLENDPFLKSAQKGFLRRHLKKYSALSPWLSEFLVEPSLSDVFVRTMLQVEPVRNSRLVKVSIMHPDPARAASIANSLVKLFIQRNLEDRFSISQQATGLISKQLIELKDRVSDAERKLQQYKEDHSLMNIPSMRKQDSFLQEARLELVKIQSEEAKVAKRYLPDHPVRIHIRSQIEGLQSKIEEEEKKNIELSRKAIDYSELEREAESSRQIYESLLKRLQETSSEAQTQASNITVVDLADMPERPAKPRPFLNLLIGLFIGAIGSILIAFFREYLDPSIKIPEDVEKGLGLELLGIIPEAEHSSKGLAEGELFFLPDRHTPASESFRALRTALLFRLRTIPGCRVLLVTSPNPGEGKTSVTLNLAMAFEQNHLKVLLIDADLRKPRLHKLLGVSRENGLKEILEGEKQAKDVIHKSLPGFGFDFLSAGSQSVHPTEILGAPQMQELMKELKKTYDIILFDSSPHLAVADVMVLNEHAHGVLVVARYHRTDKRHLADIRGRFRLGGDTQKVAGVVINKVSVKEKDYYYHQYYYYGYGEEPAKK